MKVSRSIPIAISRIDSVSGIDPLVGDGNLGARIGLDGRLNHNTKGASSSTAQRPKEISVGNRVGNQKLSVGGDHFVLKNLVDCKTELARERRVSTSLSVTTSRLDTSYFLSAITLNTKGKNLPCAPATLTSPDLERASFNT